MRRARPRKTERSATEVAVAIDTIAKADTILHAITATIEIETSTIETNDRVTTERPLKNVRGANAKKESATINPMIDHAESIRIDAVDHLRAMLRTA